jgi:hypothetical protein
MTDYQKEQVLKNGALTALTAEIAKGLGNPWKVRPPREDRDEHTYPSRWIVNDTGAELAISTDKYHIKPGRVEISGSMFIGRNRAFEQVYENGTRAEVPTITVAIERGVDVIVKEIQRRLLPEYLRILALAQTQAKRHEEKTAARQARIRKLAAISGDKVPDFEREPESDRLWTKHGTVQVHYDKGVTFERLGVTEEQAEFILTYLSKTTKEHSE